MLPQAGAQRAGRGDLFALDSSDDGEDIVAGAHQRKAAQQSQPGAPVVAAAHPLAPATAAVAARDATRGVAPLGRVVAEAAEPRPLPVAAGAESLAPHPAAAPASGAVPAPASAAPIGLGGAPSPDNILTRDPEALQRQLQEVVRNGAKAREEIGQFQEALQDSEAYLACYKEESRTLNLQVERMRQDVRAEHTEAVTRLVSEDAESRFVIMRQTDDVQQRAHQTALRAANEEIYRKLMLIDQLRLAHLDQETAALDARHNAAEKQAELHAATVLVAELSSRDVAVASGSSAAEQADAEGSVQTLRAECAAKDTMLQEMSQELLQHEDLAAKSAMENKRNEDRLAAARQRMQELEDELEGLAGAGR